jgi:hypothetical protein
LNLEAFCPFNVDGPPLGHDDSSANDGLLKEVALGLLRWLRWQLPWLR